MASKKGIVADNMGNASDWIEIFNASEEELVFIPAERKLIYVTAIRRELDQESRLFLISKDYIIWESATLKNRLFKIDNEPERIQPLDNQDAFTWWLGVAKTGIGTCWSKWIKTISNLSWADACHVAKEW